jgi:protein involved in polysaccharide export with SLBB domain
LIVPPIGPTIAIAGAVKQPGIYEILKDHSTTTDHEGVNSERLSMKSALSLCGGVLAAGQNRFMHLSLSLNGSEDVQTIVDPLAPLLRDGSVLLVSSTEETRQGMVELTGHTRKNGIHPLSKNPALSALLSPEALGEKVYPLLGVIERFDPVTLKRSFISFPLHLVLRGTHDQKLADRDTVHLFSLPQIYNLMQDTAPSLIQPALSGTKDTQTTQSYQEAMIPDPLLRSILREQSVFVKGAVRLAGAYPVTHETSLDDILNVTGGLTLEANPERIEVTTLQASGENERHLVNLQQSNPASIILKSGSTIRVNETNRKMKNDTIYISGQVVQPGDYNLVPGDRLSTLLARAGGLTPEAYPEGAIFSRMSERKAEEARFRAAAQELEQSLAAAIENNKNNKPDYNQIAMTKSLAGELRSVKAVGRITVEADPYELQLHPELDIVLQPGDKIHIPVRPYIVRVRGEVLSPANLQFREDKSPRDYVREAGGFTHYADKERSFVVHPDGSAQPLASAYWRHKPDIIPPGSTIIVPRDPKPFDFMETAKDISQILGNLAVSAVVIDDLQNDE